MNDNLRETKTPQPILLTILGNLSIFSNGVLIILHVFLLFGAGLDSFLLKIPVIDVITEEGMHGNVLYFLLKIGLHAACIYGLILLLNMQRKGFYIYVGIQGVMLLLPFLFLRSLGMSYLMLMQAVSLIFTLLFIFVFAVYLPKMK